MPDAHAISVSQSKAPISGAPILVAVTPSDRAQRALSRACAAAATLRSPLHAFRVVDEPEFKTDHEPLLQDLSASARKARENHDLTLTAEIVCYPDHYTDHEFGRAVCLADAATKLNAGLIILGTNNIKSSRRSFATTMTQRLVQHMPCPLLIAANESHAPYTKVLVAVDFSAVSLPVINEAHRLAPTADLHLVHIDKEKLGTADTDSIRARMTELAESSEANGKQTVHVEVRQGPPTPTLTDAIKDLKPDLLVLGTKGRTGLARVLLGSVAADFVENPPCDLLLLRSPPTN